jgi:hypothetical protein
MTVVGTQGKGNWGGLRGDDEGSYEILAKAKKKFHCTNISVHCARLTTRNFTMLRTTERRLYDITCIKTFFELLNTRILQN